MLSAMDQLPTELNIITLNCWGLKHISKLRTERLKEIGRRIATSANPPHIVALQECWCQEDYRSIRRETRITLPYGKFYHSGAFGAGLVILSKWPIEESTMWRYPLNGRPTAFWRGDWYVGKGIACAKIRYGPGAKDIIEVFNTHLHAPYEKEPKDSYVCHRTAQAWEMAKLLRGAAERGHLVVGLGDFNMLPLSLAHRLITAHAPVRDAWRVLHPDSSLGPAHAHAERSRRRPIPTADFNVRENGITSDSVFNTWRWTRKQQKLLGEGKEPCIVPPDAIDLNGKRLDYIFAGTGNVAASGGRGWVVRTARVGMVDRHERLGCSLSDHFSVEATLAFHSPSPGGGRASADAAVSNGAYLQTQSPTVGDHPGVDPFDAQLKPADEPLSVATYDDILAVIHKYMLRERKQRFWRGVHFCLAVVVEVACLVGVWFSPHNYVAFLLLLVGSLVLAAGTVDGLIALLFVGAEIRALKEFRWEIMNAKSGGDLALEIPREGDKLSGMHQ